MRLDSTRHGLFVSVARSSDWRCVPHLLPRERKYRSHTPTVHASFSCAFLMRSLRLLFGSFWEEYDKRRPFIEGRRSTVNDCRTTTYTIWPGSESNRRHTDFQSVALPTELPGPQPRNKRSNSLAIPALLVYPLAPKTFLAPTTLTRLWRAFAETSDAGAPRAARTHFPPRQGCRDLPAQPPGQRRALRCGSPPRWS